jgi:hypothetical protein
MIKSVLSFTMLFLLLVGRVWASDPCSGHSVGYQLAGGALCDGTWNGYSYMTTPKGCTQQSTPITSSYSPTCSGSSADPQYDWASGSGSPSAEGANTNAFSATYGGAGAGGNTAILITYADTNAAQACYYMNYGGYTDWYLPAGSTSGGDEITETLQANWPALGLGQFNYYYASTEGNAYSAASIFMNNGSEGTGPKNSTNYVRCVRRYTAATNHGFARFLR